MITLIKSMLNNNENSGLSFHHIDYSSIIKITSYEDFRASEIAGIVVHSLFTKDEIKSILSCLGGNLDDIKTQTTYGYSFGMGFFESMGKLDKYFDVAKKAKEHHESNFGGLLINRIIEAYQAVFGNNEIGCFNIYDNNIFNPGIFKVVFPNGRYQIGLHKDDQCLVDDCFIPFRDYVNGDNPISHILLLENASIGGHIKIYNREISKKISTMDNMNDRFAFLKNKPAYIMHLKPGDFLIFKGGELFHEVIKSYGLKNRISFSGLSNVSRLDPTRIDLFS